MDPVNSSSIAEEESYPNEVNVDKEESPPAEVLETKETDTAEESCKEKEHDIKKLESALAYQEAKEERKPVVCSFCAIM